MCHLCEHTLLTHLTTSTKYTCGLSIGINVLPDFWHINWAYGLSTSAANCRDFTVTAFWISEKDMAMWPHHPKDETHINMNTYSTAHNRLKYHMVNLNFASQNVVLVDKLINASREKTATAPYKCFYWWQWWKYLNQ